MLDILVSASDYKKVNDIMWDVITYCNKTAIIVYEIKWADIFIKTKNCNIQFCLDKEVNKLTKKKVYDAVFKASKSKKLIRYITEVEKWLFCDLKKGE